MPGTGIAGGAAIGIDIGGTKVRAARVGSDGRLAERFSVPTDSGPRVPELVVELVERLLDDDILGIGIGIPGRLDATGTTILSSGFVDLAGARLGEDVAQASGRPVVLDNDAHMALVAELSLGAARDALDVVLFTVGTGIGGAVASRREMVRGQGNAGQLGHVLLDAAGPLCNCGRRGCAEVFASGTALGGLIREAGLPDGTTVEALLERHDTDTRAADVLRRWAEAWRRTIDTVVAVVDPDLVVLGGGLGTAAVASLRAFAPRSSPWFTCPVEAAELGDDAGVVGAGLRALAR
jgi:glucokinase